MKKHKFTWKDERVTYLWPDYPLVLAGDRALQTVIEGLDNNSEISSIAQILSQNFSVSIAEARYYVEDIYETLQDSVWKPAGQNKSNDTLNSSQCLSMATFNITRRCNLKCAHCYAHGSIKKAEELSAEEISHAIHQLSALIVRPPKLLVISGGEPTLVPDKLRAAILAARESGLTPRLNTNGLLITDEMARFLADQEVLVQVSLDGIDPETHAILRGSEKSFFGAKKAIRILNDNGCRVRISFTVHQQNLEQIPSMIDLAEDMGAEQLITSSLVGIGHAKRNSLQTINHSEEFTALYEAVSHSKAKQFITRSTLLSETINAIRSGIRFSYCGTGSCTCCIDSDGRIFPCINMMRDDFCAGRITHEPNQFQKVWKSSKELSLLRSLKIDSMNPKCSKCAFRYFCGGYCRGETLASGAEINDPYVRCTSWKQGLIKVLDFLSETPDLYDFGEEVSGGIHRE